MLIVLTCQSGTGGGAGIHDITQLSLTSGGGRGRVRVATWWFYRELTCQSCRRGRSLDEVTT